MDFINFKLEDLIAVYKKAENELQQALISGESWDEVKDKRSIVTKLAQEIWKKKQLSSNSTPADSQIRGD
jgi:hypothetical protein